MLIFAGLGVSTKNASREGSFRSSVHSELCKGAVQAVSIAVLLLLC